MEFHFDAERTQPTCISILTEENTWLLQRQNCTESGADLAITTSYLQSQLAVYLTQLPGLFSIPFVGNNVKKNTAMIIIILFVDGEGKNYFMGAIDQGLSTE